MKKFLNVSVNVSVIAFLSFLVYALITYDHTPDTPLPSTIDAEVPSTIEIDVPGVEIEIEIPLKFSPVDSSKIPYSNYLRAACRLKGGGSGGSGTCFKIDDRYVYVLTCRHVTGTTKNFDVEFWINGRISGKYKGVVSKVLKADAAVIIIPVESFPEGKLPFAIPISPLSPKVDSKVVVSVGSPNLRWQSLFEGHITKLGGSTRYGKDNVVFKPAPAGGQSGAGIIQDGMIVGVLWGSTDKTGKQKDGRGYAVNCEDLKTLLWAENLYFTANWCVYCEGMKSVIKELAENGYNIRVVNYDYNVALAKMYGVTGLPSFINYSGEVISGIRTMDELSEFYNLNEKGENE